MLDNERDAAADEDGPTVDATTSIDRGDSLSLACVLAESAANNLHNDRYCQPQHMMHNDGDEEEDWPGDRPGERPAKCRERYPSSHNSKPTDERSAGGGRDQEPPASAGQIHNSFAEYEEAFGMGRMRPKGQPQGQKTARSDLLHNNTNNSRSLANSAPQSICDEEQRIAAKDKVGVE
jgi:hypothetical protein